MQLELLRQFFGTRYHEDFYDEYENASRPIEIFVQQATLAERHKLRDAILAFLEDSKGLPEADVDRALGQNIGCMYYTYADGMTPREWLLRIVAALE